MRIFDPESPLMEALSRLADLVLLNIVVLVCCLPVVTIGAAMTGMHYVLLKMARNEEGYIVRSYFRSFRRNFLQATGMWMLFLAAGAVFVIDLGLTAGSLSGASASTAAAVAGSAAASSAGAAGLTLPPLFRYLLIAGGLWAFMVWLYAFPLLSRFTNTVFGTLRNAATLVVAAFPRTLAMTAVTFVIPLAIWFFPRLVPLFFLIGLSGPGLVCAYLYSPVFLKMEEKAGGKTGSDS